MDRSSTPTNWRPKSQQNCEHQRNHEPRKDRASILEALVFIFLPGFASAPFIFLFGITLLWAPIATVVYFFNKNMLHSVEIKFVTLTPFISFFVMAIIQVKSWISLRHDLTTATNGLILLVFVIYVSFCSGGLRFLIFQSDNEAYAFSDGLKKMIRQETIASINNKMVESRSRIHYVDLTRNFLSDCEIVAVVGWRDHFRAIKGDFSELKDSKLNKKCTVWVVQNSRFIGIIDHIAGINWPSTDVMISLQQNGSFGEYRFWMVRDNKHNIGMVAGEIDTPPNLNDTPPNLNDTLEAAYLFPKNADLKMLIDLQSEYERKKFDRLYQLLDRQNRDIDPPPVSFFHFVLATTGQFVEAFDDAITPVSIKAQITDICIHFLRLVFFLLYFESLISVRSVPQDSQTNTSDSGDQTP